MNDYKLNKCINNIQAEIFQETSEYKMYQLGFVVGQNNMLRNFKDSVGDTAYSKILEILKENRGTLGNYYDRIISADNTPNTSTDNFREFLEKCRDNN